LAARAGRLVNGGLAEDSVAAANGACWPAAAVRAISSNGRWIAGGCHPNAKYRCRPYSCRSPQEIIWPGPTLTSRSAF